VPSPSRVLEQDADDYIRSHAHAVATFLRVARERGLSEKDFESLTQQLEKEQ